MSQQQTISVSGHSVLASSLPLNNNSLSVRLNQNMKLKNTPVIPLPVSKCTSVIRTKPISIETSNTFDMKNLKDIIDAIAKKLREIMTINHASIFDKTNVLNEMTQAIDLFKPFFHDINYYYRTVRVAEETGSTNRLISTASLKSSSFTFSQKWKVIVSVFNTIYTEGIPSLMELLDTKFRNMEGIVNAIVLHDKKSIHLEYLKKEGSRVIETINSIKKNIGLMLSKPDLLRDDPRMLENCTDDLKTFLQRYNEVHYREFGKSGLMQCQLNQYKANIQSSVNDIIVGLRAAFTFENDMSEIQNMVEDASCQIQSIIDTLDLPPFVSSNLFKRKSSPEKTALSSCKSTALTELKDSDTTDNSFETVKLSNFLDKVKKMLAVEFKTNGIWDNLDEIYQSLHKKIRDIEEKEKEFNLFNKRVFSQSKTIASLMKDSHEQKHLSEDNENKLKSYIKDLEDRNDELIKQRNEALNLVNKKDDQIFALRSRFDESKTRECLERVATRLNSMLDESEREFSFKKDDLVTRAERMSLFILERRCKDCSRYIKEMSEIESAIKTIRPLRESESISQFIKEIGQKLKEKAIIKEGTMTEINIETTELDNSDETSGKKFANAETQLNKSETSNSVGIQNEKLKEVQEGTNDSDEVRKEMNEEVQGEHNSISEFQQEAAGEVRERASNSSEVQNETIKEFHEETNNLSEVQLETVGEIQERVSNSSDTQKETVKEAQEETKNPNKIQKQIVKEIQEVNNIGIKGLDNTLSTNDSSEFAEILRQMSQLIGINDLGNDPVQATKVLWKKIYNKYIENNELLNEREKTLQNVEKWMLGRCDYQPIGRDINAKLEELMQAIDDIPNPLLKGYNDLSNERRQVKSTLDVILAKVCGFLRTKKPDTRKMNPPQVLSNLSDLVGRIHDLFDQKQKGMSALDAKTQLIVKELISLRQRLIRFANENREASNGTKTVSRSMNDNLSEDPEVIIKEIQGTIDEIFSSGGVHFIAKSEISQLTEPARKRLNIQSVDPVQYIKEIVNYILSMEHSIEVVEAFEKPLVDIFSSFDFKKENFDPMLPSFMKFRENLFQMHSMLAQTLNKTVDKNICSVLSKLVSLGTSLFSTIAAMNVPK